MTDYATNGAGTDWDTAANWTPNGIPGTDLSDTAVISHDMIINSDTTIGGSGVEDVAAITQNASLTLATGNMLTVRGDHEFANNQIFTGDAGTTYKIDSSLSASPATTQYRVHLGTSNNHLAKFIMNGTSGNRCAITSETANSAMPGQFGPFANNQTWNMGVLQIKFTDITNLGTGDETLSAFNRPRAGKLVDDQNIYFEDCTFDNCASVHIQVYQNIDVSTWFKRCDWTNSLGTLNVNIVPSTTIENNFFEDCVFDLAIRMLGPADIIRCYTVKRPAVGNASNFTIVDSFMGKDTVNNFTNIVSMTGGVIFCNTLEGNPHGLNTDDKQSAYNFVGVTFATLGGPGGDWIILKDGDAGGTTVLVDGCLTLPSYQGNSVGGVLVLNQQVGSLTVVTCTHNTIFQQGVAVSEANPGSAGVIASFKSNLVWGTLSSGQYKVYDVGTDDPVIDMMASGDATNNAGFNLLNGTNGKNYDQLEFSSGSPGANDVQDIDPLFVESSRNIPTYDTAGLGNPLGPQWDGNSTAYVVGNVVSQSSAGIYNEQTINYRCINNHLSATGDPTDGAPGDNINTTSWNTNWELQSLFRLREDTTRIPLMTEWIFTGYTPQAPEYMNSAADGTAIGAVQPASLLSTVTASNTVGASPVAFSWTEVAP